MKKLRYFCRINTPADEYRLGTRLHIGPAYKKVQAVAKAVASANVSIAIVSVPVARLSRFNWKLGSSSNRIGLVENRSYGAFGFPLLDRFTSSIVFAVEAISAALKREQVILYNFFPEYFLAALFLKLFGRPAILDIEDAPRRDEPGPRGMVTRFSYLVLSRLSSSKKITVSQQVSKTLRLGDACIVYGATSEIPPADGSLVSKDKEKWRCCERLQILYGGSLMPETGIEVFVEACKKLLMSTLAPVSGLDIHITGFGGEGYLSELLQLADGHPWIRIHVSKDLPTDEYDALLKSVHAALCLKIPGTSIGDTTFPSKVVEISGAGLLLITTPVSDVPELFGEESAVLLREPYADSLFEIVSSLLQDMTPYGHMAARGRLIAEQYFGEKAVGKRLVDYIWQ